MVCIKKIKNDIICWNEIKKKWIFNLFYSCASAFCVPLVVKSDMSKLTIYTHKTERERKEKFINM